MGAILELDVAIGLALAVGEGIDHAIDGVKRLAGVEATEQAPAATSPSEQDEARGR